MRASTTTRLSLVIGLAVVVTLGVFGYTQLRREERELRAVAERELQVLGTVVEIAVANALRDGQGADVRETLDSLQQIDPALHIELVDGQGVPLAAHGVETPLPGGNTAAWVRERRAVLPALLREAVAERAPVTQALGTNDRAALLLAQPLRADAASAPLGAILLTRSLRDLGRDLRVTTLTLFTSLAMAGLAVLWVGRLAGRHYVTTPLDAIGAAMREVRDGDGSVRITARHQGEVGALVQEFNAMVAAVTEARQRLEQEVEARHALEQGLQQVDKLVTVGQLASGLAHEIGSPLQVLHGRAMALRDAAHEPTEVRRQATILVAQTERIIRIVQQLLQFGRRLPLMVAPHDLARVVGAMIEFIEPAARRRGVTLTFEHDGELPPVPVDADRLQQVTLNLLTNALRATDRGGRVHVSLRRARGPADEPTAPAITATDPAAVGPDRIELTVVDSGCGIAPALLPRLFEPFFTTAASEGGAGLGLAVARSIVLEHGGQIAVESTEGRGSRFVVSLPLRSATATGSDASVATMPPRAALHAVSPAMMITTAGGPRT